MAKAGTADVHRMYLDGQMELVQGRVIGNPWYQRRMGAHTPDQARQRNPLFDAERIEVLAVGIERGQIWDPEEPENCFDTQARWADVRATTAPRTPRPRSAGDGGMAAIREWMRRLISVAPADAVAPPADCLNLDRGHIAA